MIDKDELIRELAEQLQDCRKWIDAASKKGRMGEVMLANIDAALSRIPAELRGDK